MLLLVLLAFQSGPPDGPALLLPPTLSAKRECRSDDVVDEVVVCGRPNDEFRLEPLPDRYQAGVPRAEFALPGGAKAAAETEQGGVGGFPSNRVMLRLKIPL